MTLGVYYRRLNGIANDVRLRYRLHIYNSIKVWVGVENSVFHWQLHL